MLTSRYGKSTLLSLAALLALVACGGGAPSSLVASPSDVAFGDVVVGGSASRVVTLSNAAASPVTILDVSASGTGLAATGPALPLRLAPGERTTFAVRVAPQVSGDVAGTVTVRTDSTQDALTTVTYAARAVLPSSGLTTSPATVDFGDVAVDASASRAVTLTNASSRAVTLSAVTSSNGAVSATGLALPLTLAAGASTTFELGFRPTMAGAVSGYLALSAEKSKPLALVEYRGSGTAAAPALSATPAQLDFHDVVVGEFSTQTVTLANASAKTVTISELAASGAGFSVSGASLPVDVAAGSSIAIGVRFTPTAAGAATGTVTAMSSGQPLATVATAGSGIAPAAAVTGVTVEPATVDVSGTVQLAADVASTGAVDTSVTWSVESGSLGTVDAATGVYTAPTAAGTYHVVATSKADPTKQGVGVVTVTDTASAPVITTASTTIAIAISPTSTSVPAGLQRKFSATVSGTINTGVTWSIQEGAAGGTISSTGTATAAYKAPQTPGTYHVVARSSAATTRTAVATVTVTPAITVSISPTTASVATGGTKQFTATVANFSNTAVTWSVQEGAAGGTVSTSGLYTAPATAGTYHVVARSVADTTRTATATVTVAAPAPVSVAVSPTTTALTTGGTKTFTASVTGNTNTAVTWSVQEGAAGGTVTTGGLYTAPATAGTYHVVARSAADTTKTATATVTVSAPTTTTPPPTGVLPAFPGAQGGGAIAKGGRGGVVYEVTNLNDSGTGSLRACVQATGPRTCVFRVGGTIQLASQMTVTSPYLTVAGQTAPGDGIQLSGKNMSNVMVAVKTHDVIWRFTRLRKGYNAAGGNDVFGLQPGTYNVILDHNSLSWSQDENAGIWGGPHDVTLSYNIFTEPLYPHPVSVLIGATTRDVADTMVNIDLHHNFISNSGHRNPLLKQKSGSFVNNIVYNICNYSTQIGGGGTIDVVGNRYKRGPMQLSGGECAGFATSKHVIEAFPGGNDTAATGTPSLYIKGNVAPTATAPSTDDWAELVYEISGENAAEVGKLSTTYRRTSPRSIAVPIMAHSADTLDSVVLPQLGVYRRLDCNGGWVGVRDATDARVLNEYTTTTGPSRRPSVEPSWPTIRTGTACADTDHDGMPDAWETAQGLNPANAADGKAISASGYSNLERYLNGN